MVAFGRLGRAASGDGYSPARREMPRSVAAADVDDEGPILVDPAFRSGHSAVCFAIVASGRVAAATCRRIPDVTRTTTRLGHFEDHCASPETRARPGSVAGRGGEGEPSRGLRQRLPEMPGGVDPVPFVRCGGDGVWGNGSGGIADCLRRILGAVIRHPVMASRGVRRGGVDAAGGGGVAFGVVPCREERLWVGIRRAGRRFGLPSRAVCGLSCSRRVSVIS